MPKGSTLCTYDKDTGSFDYPGFSWEIFYNVPGLNHSWKLPLGEHTLNVLVLGYDGDDCLDSGGHIVWDKWEEFEIIYSKDIHFKIENAPEAPEYILGDVNNDGNVDVSDAIKVLQHSSGKIKLTDTEKLAANVADRTQDEIDVSDAIKILQFSSGKIKKFE